MSFFNHIQQIIFIEYPDPLELDLQEHLESKIWNPTFLDSVVVPGSTT